MARFCGYWLVTTFCVSKCNISWQCGQYCAWTRQIHGWNTLQENQIEEALQYLLWRNMNKELHYTTKQAEKNNFFIINCSSKFPLWMILQSNPHIIGTSLTIWAITNPINASFWDQNYFNCETILNIQSI